MAQATRISDERYLEVVEQLVRADYLYHNDPDHSTLTDAAYDALFDQLAQYETETGHIDPKSPTQYVSGKATLSPVNHPVPMLSLAKVTTDAELAAFLERIGPDTQVYVEPKYDGASLSLHYQDGDLAQAVTRGDGMVGDDVTVNARNIAGIPLEIPGFTGIIRGEVMIRKADLELVNQTRVAEGLEPFANTRNAASGGLRNSDPKEARKRRLVFYPYDVTQGDEDAWDALPVRGEDLDLMCPQYHTQVLGNVMELLERRAGFEFDIDGVVIKVADRKERERLGSTHRVPNWAVAFKVVGTIERTVLTDVIWDTGPGGTVTPVAVMEPVSCMGVTITNASLHNAKFILDRDLRIGDAIEVTRANDVIPYVIGKASQTASGNEREIELPTHCPRCQTELIQKGNSGQLRCPGGWHCDRQAEGRLKVWASRPAAKIDAIGPEWISRFVQAFDWFRTPDSFYQLTVHELVHVADRTEGPGLNHKGIQRFLDSIEKSKQVGMRKALIGLCIPNVSDGTAKRLCERYETVEQVAAASTDELETIRDIGPVVARSIHEYFNLGDPTAKGCIGRRIIENMRAQGVNLNRLPEDAPKTLTANSRNFVLTGKISGYTNRKEFAQTLEAFGWVAQSSVGKTTHYLVTDDENTNSGKAKKARDLGVEVVSSHDAVLLATP